MLNHLDELLVYLDIVRAHVLTVLERDLYAELVQFGLLVLVELAVLERHVIPFKLLKHPICHRSLLFLKLFP